jgi:hypothetical protein
MYEGPPTLALGPKGPCLVPSKQAARLSGGSRDFLGNRVGVDLRLLGLLSVGGLVIIILVVGGSGGLGLLRASAALRLLGGGGGGRATFNAVQKLAAGVVVDSAGTASSVAGLSGYLLVVNLNMSCQYPLITGCDRPFIYKVLTLKG